MSSSNKINRFYETVVKPTLPLIIVIGVLSILIAGTATLIYWDKIRFNPSTFITEVYKIGMTTTFIFWLIEYQKTKTETGREKYNENVFVRDNLLTPLLSLQKFLTEFNNGGGEIKKQLVPKIKENWIKFSSNFSTQEKLPVPIISRNTFNLPAGIDLSKIDTSYNVMLEAEDSLVTARKITEVNILIEHIKNNRL